MKKIDKKFDSRKYTHVGYSHAAVPEGWKPIMYKAIVDIEKAMWPSWMPMRVKRFIHKKATGNSVVAVRSRFWNKIRAFTTQGQIVTDIKEKFATLRIYGYFNDNIHKIIGKAELQCSITCATCGYKEEWEEDPNYMEVVSLKGWWTNICRNCRLKYKDDISKKG